MGDLADESRRYPMGSVLHGNWHRVDGGCLSRQPGQSGECRLRDGYLTHVPAILIGQQQCVITPTDDGYLGIIRCRVDGNPFVGGRPGPVAAVEALGDHTAAALGPARGDRVRGAAGEVRRGLPVRPGETPTVQDVAPIPVRTV